MLNIKIYQTCIRPGQAQEFASWIWFMDFGLLLWTEGVSGLPTEPYSLSLRLLKQFFNNVIPCSLAIHLDFRLSK